ncbi:DUF5919 domain-containing protein [Thermogemmatispora sp.]|uniref:helix-turn-helix domain-containing protein n=1 Tax=Thermogemmatispora sp. TaxID=1968838 RepID=UPI0035E3FAA8
MENERLRSAMARAHLDIEALAEQVHVDPKTVRRWLHGSIPHPRHRWKVSELLHVPETSLWTLNKDTTSSSKDCTSEIVAAYAHRSDFPPEAWWRLFLQAGRQIDLLGIALLFLPEQHPRLIELLKEKASAGCQVRIALANPDSEALRMRDAEEHPGTLPPRIHTTLYHFRDILHYDGIQIRFHSTVLYISYARFDDEMVVMPQLFRLHGSKAPLLHLRSAVREGIFTNFAAHFEAVWETTASLEAVMGCSLA